MNFFARARDALTVDNDALADYRDGISMHLSGIAGVLLLPLGVLHVLGGRWLLAGVNGVLIAALLINTWSLRRGRRPVVPFALLVSMLIVGTCVSVSLQGVPGVLWSYPALFIGYFVLARRAAVVLSLVLLAAVMGASAAVLGLPLALRVLMSQAFVLVMINVVLNVIGQLQAALVAQAITDPLTGAYNRRYLQTQLAQRVVTADPSRPSDALLAIDVDDFKKVNDCYGHDVGDDVLRRLVAAVAARKRGSDLLFRTGGEEFMLLLPRVSADAALHIAEALRQRLAQADLLPDETVTVSIGVSALYAGQSPQAWVKSADNALYEAKRTGRNRVVVAAAG